MELIIKPLSLCNFKCTFCSSTVLGDSDKDRLPLSEVKRFLERFPETNTIIVNGGDPLMMPPSYYWDLLTILKELDSKAIISLTTNLWAFFKKPEMWTELLKHPQVSVCTSFQYGDGRLKGDLTPYTESEFWAVSDMMLERVGYRPDFISVIGVEEADTVIKTVELAKRMGVEAKVNKVFSSGPEIQYKTITYGGENQFYSLADMYERYLEIYDKGLMEWEYNTKQLTKALLNGGTTCPLARDCDENIRNLQPSGRYYSCGSFGDDDLYRIDFESEMSGGFTTPLQDATELEAMKEACHACPMFTLCNGCRKTVHDTKRMGQVEKHCIKMKTLAPRIIELNGLTGLVEITPYVNETPAIIFKGCV